MSSAYQLELAIQETNEFKALQEVHPGFQGRMSPQAREELKQASKFKTNAKNERLAEERYLDELRAGFGNRAMQIIRSSLWRQKGPASEKDWQKAPATFFKLLQECLEKKADHIAIDRSEVASEAARREAFSALIIDCGLITDTLLHNFGLDEFIPPKGTKASQAAKMREKAIDEIRKMVLSVRPFLYPHQDEDTNPPAYFRVMLLDNGKRNGYLLGTQRIEGQRTIFRTDIYGAERRVRHIEQTHSAEIKLLREILPELEKGFRMLENWGSIKGTEDIDTLRSKLLEIIETFKHVRNDQKVKIKKQVEKALTVKYKSGVMNPGAVRANLSSAISQLGKRLEEIERIASYIRRDGVQILNIAEGERKRIFDFLQIVEEKHDDLKILRKSASPLSGADRMKLKTSLGKIFDQAAEIRCEPNLSFALLYRSCIGHLINALESESDDEIRTRFTKIYLIAKLFRTQVQLQKVLMTVSCQEDFDPVHMLADLETIYRQLRESRINNMRKDGKTDDSQTKEFTEPYIEVYEHLRALIGEMKNYVYAQRGADAVKIANRIRERIANNIKNKKILYRLFISLTGSAIESVQAHLPFSEEKSEVTSRMKKRLKSFNWKEVLEALEVSDQEALVA